MKKLSIVLLSVLLLIVFVGCDLSVETMGKMGKNLAGTDKNYVASIIKQTEPEAAEKDSSGKIDGGSFTISITDSIIESTTTYNANFSINGKEVTITSNALKDIEAIILPSSTSGVSDIIQGLKSGNNSADIKKELEKPAEGSSLTAAKGTASLFIAVLDGIKIKPKGADDPLSAEDIKFNDNIQKIQDDFAPEEITNGDVVALTALTNIIFNDDMLYGLEGFFNPPEKTDYETTEEYNKAKEEHDALSKKIQGDVINQYTTLVELATYVPSNILGNTFNTIYELMGENGKEEESK